MKRLKRFLTPFIKVKNTKKFWIGIFIIVLLFIAGYVHNNNIAYIGMFFVFSLMSFSLLFGRINISKAEVRFEKRRFFANEEYKLPLIVKGEAIEFDNRVKFDKRGYNDLEIEIFSLYPIGIAKFSKTIKIKDILVYPKLKGESLKSAFLRGEEMDFDSLKEYEGEGLKYIHWASLAKGDIKAKKFGGESRVDRLLFDYSLLKGDKEERISQLAKWAKEAFDSGIEFEIILPDKKISSKEGFDEVFKELALY